MKQIESNAKTLIILFSAIGVLRCLIWLSPSPLMTFMMEDMNLNYAQSGMILLIVSVMMGISLFIGSFVIDRLGASHSMSIACIMLGLDGVICFCAPSFSVLMIGRVLSGLGMGLSMGAMNTLIAERFSRQLQNFMNTLNLILSSLGMALAYVLSVPLMKLFHSYRTVFLLWGILTLIVACIFAISERGKTSKKTKSTTSQSGSGTPSLLAAAKFKNVWIIAVSMAGAMWVYNSFSTYLPSYLSQFRLMSAESAGIATSIMQFSGIVGSLLCGVLLGRRTPAKRMLFTGVCLIFIGALGTSLIPSGLLLYICVFLVGMGYYIFQTASVTAIMRLPGMKPTMMAGATAIYTGIGSLLGMAVPSIFDMIQASYSMQTAFVAFSMITVVSIIVLFLYREKNSSSTAR